MFCCVGTASLVHPDHYLLSDGGKVLETPEGKILVTEILGENEMLFSDYRPWRDESDFTTRTTNVKADNPINPTNWVPVHSVVLPNLPAGRYHGSLSFTWSLNTILVHGLFRTVLNGVANRQVPMHAGSSDNIDVQNWEIAIDHAGGDMDLRLDYLVEDSGGTYELTVDRSWIFMQKVS